MDPQETRAEPLDILILAAGLGTRMRSNTAKVLHLLDGRPLVSHVCHTAAALAPRKVYVVVGHQGRDVRSAVLTELPAEQTVIVEQKEQLGTGDAVNSAREYLENDDALLLILSGDVPMIRAETLGGLIQRHRDHRGRGAACTILTVKLKDPTGYGRIIRDSSGIFEKIVEQRDATETEAEINEINSGIYCFNARKLFAALSRVQNHNDQGEYYLTDVPALLKADGEDVALYSHGDPFEVEGVNNRMQLADLERHLRRRTIARLMLDYGVTFIDPTTAYVSERASIGRDTIIHPNVTIEGRTEIGDGCEIRSGSTLHRDGSVRIHRCGDDRRRMLCNDLHREARARDADDGTPDDFLLDHRRHERERSALDAFCRHGEDRVGTHVCRTLRGNPSQIVGWRRIHH